MLDNPSLALESPNLPNVLAAAVRRASEVLHGRLDYLADTGQADDFKVDFKRETALRELGSIARRMGSGWADLDSGA
jgi:hypothetical protein